MGMGISHVLGQVAQLNPNVRGMMQNRRQEDESKRQQREFEDRQRAADQQFAEHMQEMGARPVINGVVKRDITMPQGPTSTLPDGTEVPGSGGDTFQILDKADPSRLVKHKSAEGEAVAWELPTPAESIGIHASRLQKQFEAEAPTRAAANKERVGFDEELQGARRRGQLKADQENREQIGMPVPSALDEYFPGISGGGTRKVLPTELDDILRSTGQYMNFKSEAENRGKPKPRELKDSRISTSDSGDQVVVNTYSDGTVEEKPIAAKGKKSRPEGSITAYQQAELDRQRERDRKADEKDRRDEVMTWQTKLDNLQKDEDEQHKVAIDTGKEITETQAQLDATDANKLKGSARARAITKMADLRGRLAGAQQKIGTIQQQKKAADKMRRSLMGQQQAGSETVTIQTSDGQTFLLPKGNLAAAQKRDPGLKVLAQ